MINYIFKKIEKDDIIVRMIIRNGKGKFEIKKNRYKYVQNLFYNLKRYNYFLIL